MADCLGEDIAFCSSEITFPLCTSPSFLLLTVRDKEALEARKNMLHAAGIQTAEFHEPYKDWGLTAIAFILAEDQRHLCKDLPLWKLPTQPLEVA